MVERRFSDQEVREILEEAATRVPSLPGPRSDGLSLPELKSIAAEAGIDPAGVEEAAMRRLDRPGGRTHSVAGLPRLLTVERRVQGTVEAAHAADLIGAVRAGLGQVGGRATEVAGTLEWQGDGDTIGRHVALSSRDGHTTIRASTNLSTAALRASAPAGIIGLGLTIAAAVGFSDTGGLNFLALAISILPALYLVVRFILRRVAAAESEQMEATVNELARLLSEQTGPPGEDVETRNPQTDKSKECP